jgi:hypothetical protein
MRVVHVANALLLDVWNHVKTSINADYVVGYLVGLGVGYWLFH